MSRSAHMTFLGVNLCLGVCMHDIFGVHRSSNALPQHVCSCASDPKNGPSPQNINLRPFRAQKSSPDIDATSIVIAKTSIDIDATSIVIDMTSPKHRLTSM